MDARVGGGGGRCRAQHEAGVDAGISVRGQVDLAVPEHQTLTDRLVPAGPPTQGAAQRGVDPLPGVVAPPRDRAGCRGQPVHERVGGLVVERRRHRVLLLEEQPVARPARTAVELHPGRQQGVVGGLEHGVVALPEETACRLRPVQGVDVAETTSSLLQVRLEEEGHLTRDLVPAPHPTRQLLQPSLGPLLPLLEGPTGEVVGEVLVAGEVAHLQQRRRRVEVVGRQRQRLAAGSHRVAELQALVPDRVPDAIGEGADVGPTGVQQHDVDVRLEAQLRPSVPAHGHERHAAGAALRLGRGQEVGEPAVHEVAVGPAQRPPDEGVVASSAARPAASAMPQSRRSLQHIDEPPGGDVDGIPRGAEGWRVGQVEVDQVVDAQSARAAPWPPCRSASPIAPPPRSARPSSRPVPRSPTSFIVIGRASGR